MSKSRIALFASLLALGSALPAAVVGSDAGFCVSGKPSMVVGGNGLSIGPVAG